jgi:hypothetical protein
MLKALGSRLSYANVMATLAVFIAAGGSSYAVARLNGSQIRNRTIDHTKLKRHTLSGTEVNLGRLGKVPTASRADSSNISRRAGSADTATHASSADTAINAGSAANATHAGSSDNATNAANASTLGGLAPSSFKVGCPSDTTPVAGECVETASRAATSWISAEANCGAAGRRMASIGGLIAFGKANTTAMTAAEWVDTFYEAVTSMGGAPTLNSVRVQANGGGVTVGRTDSNTSQPYRCVTGPTN